MSDSKVETISRLAQWKIENFGSCSYKKSDPFKVGIWNWHLSIEKNRYLYIRLFPEPSRFSKEQPPLARFVLRVSNTGLNRKPYISPIHERLLRNCEDFVWPVDSTFHGRFIIDVEFLDLKICPVNGGEASSIWPSDGLMKSVAAESTLRCLSRMLEEAIHSDVTINTADGTLRAHKAILSSSSPVFQSMFRHNLKEKESSLIYIEDMSLESCTTLLCYLYGSIKQEDFWKHRLALLGAANKYDIADLKDACEESLLEDINSANVLERLQEAWLYQLDRLKKGCMTYLFDFGKIYDVREEGEGDSSEARVSVGVGGEEEQREEVVINIRCSNGTKFTVRTSLDSSISAFKAALAQNCDVPADQQRLIYKGLLSLNTVPISKTLSFSIVFALSHATKSSSMPQSQIGYLVPLTQNLDQEDTSIPKLSLSKGPNVIGRHNVPISDKRLSRKHLTLTVSTPASANLFVEGSNPIVVNSGNKRKKLYSQESTTIVDGDVVELIPGHHFFKYVTWAGDKGEDPSFKRSRQTFDNVALTTKSQDEVKKKSLGQGSGVEVENYGKYNSKGESREEAIRDFHVSNDKLPWTFRLLRVRELPAWSNTSCVSIGDVIQGDVLIAILSNYMVDIDWLLPACPTLAKTPHVLVLHGEGDGTLDHMKRKKPANWILHKPPLPISFGTHHSKAMLLVYPRGVRIIVHTANLIYVDWNNKSQGLWMQDFPWKDQNSPSKRCGFENDLIDYLSALKWPEFSVKLPALGNFNINPAFFKKFDYSDAAVRLIASVPGYHTGTNLKKWGHMKLRTVLQECTFDRDFKNSPLAYQFSSLGSLDEKWLAELTYSMSSGFSEDKTPLGLGQPRIIWPTVEDVRCSLEGYAAGNAIPSPVKNVEKEFLKKYWAKWKASHTGRCRAMPHIKTFTRYNGQKLAWLLLTSSNLSKAAWGALQKNNSQLMIRSYELGVLFLPSSFERYGSGFSCTSNGDIKEDKCRSLENSEVRRTKLVTLTWQGSRNADSSSDVIPLPVPYELPPQPYTSEDVPWSWDRRYTKKDVYGQVWPRQVQLYTFQDS